MLTLTNWVTIAFVFVIVFLIGFSFALVSSDCTSELAKGIVIALVAAIFFTVGLALCIRWYNTSTASGVRAVKDWQSELNNGIDREITITAEDGRQIFHYEGKIDIESNHADNYIKFESEEGKRYIIYYGIQDTITIIEK